MKALGSWQRKAILMHCVEQFKARKDELAMSLCIEAGKPIKVTPAPCYLMEYESAHVLGAAALVCASSAAQRRRMHCRDNPGAVYCKALLM